MQNKKIKIFNIVNALLMILIIITTVYPFLFLLSNSLKSVDSISVITLNPIPKEISFASYKQVFESTNIWVGYKNTIMRTVLGTIVALFLMIICAYPLSKKCFPDKNFWTMFIVFTMFFNGGLIPTYLVIKDLGLINKLGALILPNAINTFSMIIIRNYFMTLPSSLEESAKIDGASDYRILFQIILPISMPIIATVTLWTAVGHWNAWFDSLVYMTDGNKHVVQVILRRIVMGGTALMEDVEDTDILSPDSIKAATVMVVTIPILIVYPFIQKYFVKGIMIGSLKG